jgi:hypothetical protein
MGGAAAAQQGDCPLLPLNPTLKIVKIVNFMLLYLAIVLKT